MHKTMHAKYYYYYVPGNSSFGAVRKGCVSSSTGRMPMLDVDGLTSQDPCPRRESVRLVSRFVVPASSCSVRLWVCGITCNILACQGREHRTVRLWAQ